MQTLARFCLLVITLCGGCAAARSETEFPIARVGELVVAVGQPGAGADDFESLGSGIVLGPRIVITAAHVVSGLARVVVSVGGQRLRAQVEKFDRRRDLARLAVPQARFERSMTLGDSTRLRLGQRLFSIGYPAGTGPVVTSGVYSGAYAAGSVDRSTPAVLTDAAMAPGSSGGALITQAGELIGLNDVANVSFGVQRAVPSEVVRAFAREQ
jgi:S1-C subfamily serine protease